MTIPNRAEHPNRKMGDHTTPTAEKAKQTNSAGGSPHQRPASEEAARLVGTSKHRDPATKAVIWTQGEKGTRYEGSHVTPNNDKTGSGVTLHSPGGHMAFKDSEVAEVHYL